MIHDKLSSSGQIYTFHTAIFSKLHPHQNLHDQCIWSSPESIKAHSLKVNHSGGTCTCINQMSFSCTSSNTVLVLHVMYFNMQYVRGNIYSSVKPKLLYHIIDENMHRSHIHEVLMMDGRRGRRRKTDLQTKGREG